MEQYKEGKELIIKKLEEDLKEKRAIMTDHEYELNVLKFMEYMNEL